MQRMLSMVWRRDKCAACCGRHHRRGSCSLGARHRYLGLRGLCHGCRPGRKVCQLMLLWAHVADCQHQARITTSLGSMGRGYSAGPSVID